MPWVGKSVERVEDLALLRGQGRFMDDMPMPAACHAVAFLRSPHAHAEIVTIDITRAKAMPGVAAVITGADITAHSAPFITAVKVAAPQYPLAVERVRYVGEPMVMVVAKDRYLAEDALDAIDVSYRLLKVVVDPEHAIANSAPRLHAETKSNVLHQRSFRYGHPEKVFQDAAHVVETTVRYPRNACTPMECFGVVAQYLAGEEAFDITANFQGPYTLHPVMARALKVPGSKLRLRTPPDSGGSFGVKQGIFPYIVALGLAAKLSGKPVKWIEDRLEHLLAATSATNRVTTLKAAFDDDGRLLALDYDQLEDCGAYLRAPEPATIYRMHGNMTGAYDVKHLLINNRVVVTNKTPTGLMRGFGGPQVYFPLERLMDLAAARLMLNPLALRRRNLIPAASIPYKTASGAIYDSGDYIRSLDRGIAEGGLCDLIARRAAARADGRHYGIGYATIIEPSISNMGYITTLLTPEQRQRAGPKNGALATATVSFDPSGAITAHVSSVPQGQGHRTAIGQVVGDIFGLAPDQITVLTDHDTAKDPWSIASGNYASRFAGAVAGAAQKAALALRERLSQIAANDLNVLAEDVVYGDGKVYAKDNPDNALGLGRVAAQAHWSPLSIPKAAGSGLRETAFWTMPELTEPDSQDGCNSSGTYGFLFDFCGVEIDPDTGDMRIDKYVTMHDAGVLINPALADGQIAGGFAHGLGAALLEELHYGPDGQFRAGTFADYLLPTIAEMPDLTILHDGTPTPVTPLGAKGLGEGNCMSTPVCIANAVADALDIDVTTLPLTRSTITELIHAKEPDAPAAQTAAPTRRELPKDRPNGSGAALQGSGTMLVPATPETVWATITDETALARVIPGCHELERVGDAAFKAEMTMGVGPVKGRFSVEVAFEDMDRPNTLTLVGGATGPLGASSGTGQVTLKPEGENTRVNYIYSVEVSGKVAAVGGRMLDGAARVLIAQFFKSLVSQFDDNRTAASAGLSGFWAWLCRWLGGKI